MKCVWEIEIKFLFHTVFREFQGHYLRWFYNLLFAASQ
jgi:hypothetical protein